MSGSGNTAGEITQTTSEGETIPADQEEISLAEPEENDPADTGQNDDTDDSIPIDPAIIENLTLGTLEHYLPNLQKSKSSLNEILQNQSILIETIQQENSKFTECDAMVDLIVTMNEAKLYHAKLNNIKKEMQFLSEKSFKLKKRALKLQQQKQKEELQREQQRERELDRERMLTAKVAKKGSNET